MRHITRISESRVVAALALVLMVSGPLAAQTANFNLTSPGSGDSLAGVYTSPYQGYINNSSPTIPIKTGATTPVICDDFADNSFIEEDWAANVTSLSSLLNEGTATDTTLKWNGAIDSLDQAQAYTVAALLSISIITSNPNGCTLASPPPCTSTQVQNQEDYSYALWELFDPTVLQGQSDSILPSPPVNDAVIPWLTNAGDSGPGSDLAKATTDLNTAIGELGSTANSILSNYNVTIYTYGSALNPGGPECNYVVGACSSAPPQEFITVTTVPEPSSLAVFGVYVLFGGAGLFFGGRRRSLLR